MGPRRGASASNDASYGSARSTPTSNRNSRRSGGVPRLKSGCYTCRIRRKKCDESRGADGNGPCVSCSRLRLQCLGYGERRPTWLRDPATLEQTKQRIKSFLSQLGFSRSHRGDGSPTSDDEQDILYLDPAKINQHSSISPAPTAFSSSSLEDQNHQQHETSSVRGQHTPSYVPDYTNGMRGGSSDDTLSPASALTYPSSSCSFGGPVMSAPSLSGGYQPYGVDPFRATPSTHPALTSSFGDLYTYDTAPIFNDPTLSLDPSHCIANHDLQPSSQSPDYYMSLQYPLPDMPMFFRDAWSQGLLKHYLHNVVQREYLLADPGVRNLIWASLNQSDTARNGACLLARLHYQSLDGSQQPRAQLLATLEREAKGMLTVYGCHDEGDTFAALQIVSCFLFLGGRGKWMTYLDYAITWVERVFQTSPYDWQETLRCQSEWSRFLIKTTMWFDVLGSVTRRQAPKLLTLYRNLYHGASLDDGESPASLIPVMGCENAIVLALAETSWLASWKANLTKEGRLSTPELVKMGKRIEEEYLKPTQAPPMTSFKGHEDPAVLCRRLTSAVFRASARVYLHSVISGDNPGCPEIMEAVKDTVDALRRVPENDAIAERAVVRMVVFSICIAGCLTNQPSHRTFLLHRLASQQVEAVGNCSEVRKVMEKVWELRQAGTSASWLDVVEQASPDGYLLLV